jgi:hypothetical protein
MSNVDNDGREQQNPINSVTIPRNELQDVYIKNREAGYSSHNFWLWRQSVSIIIGLEFIFTWLITQKCHYTQMPWRCYV